MPGRSPRIRLRNLRYDGVVEAGNVFALEPSILLPGFGEIGLEEDVLVTDHGLDLAERTAD